MHLNKERREKGRHAPRAVEAINLGFATDLNTSGYKFYIEGTQKVITSNQGRFDEGMHPYRNQDMIDKNVGDLSNVDVLTLDQGGIEWIRYSADVDLNDFGEVHSGGSSDSYILRSKCNPQVYMGVKREDFFKSLLSKRSDELLVKARALVARIEDELSQPNDNRVKGLANVKDAMSRVDRQQWAESNDREYQGFYEHQILKVARPEPEQMYWAAQPEPNTRW